MDWLPHLTLPHRLASSLAAEERSNIETVAAFIAAWDEKDSAKAMLFFVRVATGHWQMIYAINAVESLRRSLCKIIKTRGNFPNDEAEAALPSHPEHRYPLAPAY